MHASVEMSEGRIILRTILAEFPPDSPHWNEAQNRYQFVDRLLTDCLGWQHPYIEVERRDEAGGKADYSLGKPIRAVLEAKREAVKFDLLPGGAARVVRKLRPLIDDCRNLSAAVTQVLQYCALNGAQLAIVCNGPQLLVFQAHVPGMSPLDGECYVFDGHAAYIDEFPLLWRLLSPDGVGENYALRQLAIHRNPRIPPKAISNIAEPQAFRYRSPFQENLRTLSSVLLENIEDNPDVKSDFYRECYVPMEANNRHLLLSKKIITARYRRNSEGGSAPAAIDARVVGGKVEIEDGGVSSSMGSRPVVILGDVGVGKTSFFENLFEKIEQAQRNQTYYIHLNLGTEATLTDSIRDYIINSIPSILRDKYAFDLHEREFIESLYQDEIVAFDRSMEGALKEIDPISYQKAKIAFLLGKTSDKGEHVKLSLEYVSKYRGKQILIVIDNADQRDFDTQQQAFLIAQELAALRRFLVFIALRPSTFFQSKISGALSGYQNKVLTISPPPADEVLRKRIGFAVRVAEGHAAPLALEGVQLNLTNIVHFLRATLRSIRSNAQIKSFLSNITGGNTRLVIEMISGFCGSPNVECERIVGIERETGDYQVPLHEFTKHALLGEYSYYNALSSVVGCNLFDVSLPDPREHFLRPIIVAYISSPLGVKDNDGFVSGPNIQKEMTRIGFNDDQIRHALRVLARRRLIETPHAHYRELQVSDEDDPYKFFFRATSIGIYHIRYWAGSFAFLDAISIDTPIFDSSSRGVVFTNAESFDIRARLRKSETFKAYLETKWNDAGLDISYYDLPSIFRERLPDFQAVQRFITAGPKNPRNRNAPARRQN